MEKKNARNKKRKIKKEKGNKKDEITKNTRNQ